MSYFIHPYTGKKTSIYSKAAEKLFKELDNPPTKSTNTQSGGGSNKLNLIYMAKPSYGGWVSFTAHLALKYNCNLYKIGNRTEVMKGGGPRLRNFGYGIDYQNLEAEDAAKLPNVLITAIDKSNYKHLDLFPKNTGLVLHDPTEFKGKSTQPVIDNLSKFKIYTIRSTVHDMLKQNFGINSKFLVHPFHQYQYGSGQKNKAVSISRVDFDKHTDVIIKANDLLRKKGNKNTVDIYGAKNDLYVYHHIKNKLNLDLDRYYKGTFGKDFSDLTNLLKNAKFVVDMSAIKGDGGGSQYTFLEAIHQNCALVLNSKWVDGVKTPFKNGHNCYVVSDENELAKLLNSNPNTTNIVKNAKKLLTPHTQVDWTKN